MSESRRPSGRTVSDDEDVTNNRPKRSAANTRTPWGSAVMDGRNPLVIALLALLAVLLVLFLFVGITRVWQPFGQSNSEDVVPTRELLVGEQSSADESGATTLGAGSAQQQGNNEANAAIPPPGIAVGPPLQAADRFQQTYNQRGLTILGLPISEPITVNGREIQWFERGRLEHWPEFAGTPYEVQLGRVGVEYTRGRAFPTQTYFDSRPGLAYFAETQHAVGEPFLTFWQQNDGLNAFGYPISEAFNETLEDGNAYLVQYFERARMEYHPEQPGAPVQLGLLGRALYMNDSRPSTIPSAPTEVPMSP